MPIIMRTSLLGRMKSFPKPGGACGECTASEQLQPKCLKNQKIGRTVPACTANSPMLRHRKTLKSIGHPMAIYLWINAALYLIFAIYCSARPEASARALGYSGLQHAGGFLGDVSALDLEPSSGLLARAI